MQIIAASFSVAYLTTMTAVAFAALLWPARGSRLVTWIKLSVFTFGMLGMQLVLPWRTMPHIEAYVWLFIDVSLFAQFVKGTTDAFRKRG